MGENGHPHFQTNSHILVNEFDYYEPTSVDEAIALLQQHGEHAQLIAGGTHLLVLMKMERELPKVLISLNKIPGLDSITVNADGSLTIGSRVNIRTLGEHPVIRTRYSGLAQACESFGSMQIEIMGTVGGNVCNGSPAADLVPPLLVFGAEVLLKGAFGERKVPLEKFLVKPGVTAIRSDEVMLGVILPPVPDGTVSAFHKMVRVVADLAKASLGLMMVRDGDRVADLHLAYGAVAPTVIRIPEAEAALIGKNFTPERAAEAAKIASERITPIDDVRSSAWYRRRVVNVMTQDALNALWEEAGRVHAQPLVTLPDGAKSAVAGTIVPQIKRGEQREIEFSVNGVKQRVRVSANDLLLNVLREKLQLTGTKYGCGVGECGACTVQLDGKAVFSCLTLAVEAAGRDVVTVEGMAKPDGTLHPLQEAFISQGAFQCGYCTPGMLMTLKALVEENPQPSEEDIRSYLKGNRCRCTGYYSIVRAVLAATGQPVPER
ncbi:MAG: FAD binding domain-containing protein [Anaerolineales bacterium]